MATPAAKPSESDGAVTDPEISPDRADSTTKLRVRGTASVALARARRPRNFVTDR